jgi:rare lipoprotein A
VPLLFTPDRELEPGRAVYVAMQQSISSHALRSRAGADARPWQARSRALGAAAVAFALLLWAPLSGSRIASIHDAVSAWTQSGRVSWYGPGFHGRRTASGETFDTNDLTMAHRSLPLGSRVRVTNLANGRSVVLRVNDRGPYVRGRIADLSHAAAARLDFLHDGVVRARIELL